MMSKNRSITGLLVTLAALGVLAAASAMAAERFVIAEHFTNDG